VGHESCFFVETSYVRLKPDHYPSIFKDSKMLRFLRIRNLALIRELEIEFGPGLNLLTGETGSGKSILVDALGLLLGARPSQEMIRSDCDAAVVEGCFEAAKCPSVLPLIVSSGIETEDNDLLIRREISVGGRNRVFINSTLATTALLKAIGEKLADIHGQQDQRSLLDLPTHLEWLDFFGGNAAKVNEIREIYKEMRRIAQKIKTKATGEQERLRKIDSLQFQIDEIQKINPKPNEKEELENEKNLLSNREKILSLATEAYSILYENELSILRESKRLSRILEELERFDKCWTPHREALEDSRYKLEDVAFAARDYAARSDFSPERLELVHQRLYALEKLTRKYGSSISEILEYSGECARELNELLADADTTSQLAQQLQEISGRYLKSAEKLSEKRRLDAERLQHEIQKEFSALAMERMRMQVRFHSRKEGEGEDGLPGFYGLNGVDHVEFLIAPNQGEEFRPLAKIASGGELSRLMLAIKSLCRNEETGKTLVFDEVDTGIGGRVAEAVGKRLRDVSHENQVLCVTHLPQIAAFARTHFSVGKKLIGERAETVVKNLNESERVDELSRMLGGEIITDTARRHALEMLEHSAEQSKKNRRRA
jgi:DNA repair protein RecN (Recombination protein N)